MDKKPIKKQTYLKEKKIRKYNYSQKHQRHYAFGFLIGDY